MTGLWQTKILDDISRYNLSRHQSLCGQQRKRFSTRNPGTSEPSGTRSCLFWHRSIAASRWPAISRRRNCHRQVRFDKSGSSNFSRTDRTFRPLHPTLLPIRSLSAAPRDRLQCYATRRPSHTPYRKSMACAVVGGGSNLLETWWYAIVQPLRKVVAIDRRLATWLQLVSKSVSQKRVVKNDPRAELVWLSGAIQSLALKQNCWFPQILTESFADDNRFAFAAFVGQVIDATLHISWHARLDDLGFALFHGSIVVAQLATQISTETRGASFKK